MYIMGSDGTADGVIVAVEQSITVTVNSSFSPDPVLVTTIFNG